MCNRTPDIFPPSAWLALHDLAYIDIHDIESKRATKSDDTSFQMSFTGSMTIDPNSLVNFEMTEQRMDNSASVPLATYPSMDRITLHSSDPILALRTSTPGTIFLSPTIKRVPRLQWRIVFTINTPSVLPTSIDSVMLHRQRHTILL
jgi:hypothetical protein